MEDVKKEKPKSSYPKGVRIIALIGVVFLLVLYVVTFIAAFTTSSLTPELFRMCVGSTILLPIMFWLYIRFAKLFMNKDRDRFGK